METRANYVIVGIFTLAAIVAAFAFVYWTAAIGDRGETITLRVRIPGSASGLGRGSAVLFNGVKVGDVTRVFIDVQNPSAAIADTTIDRLTPITTSTQADIGIAGLTGQANIELKGGNLKEPNILDQAEAQGRIPEITADPSAVTNLLQTAQDIFERADRVVTNLEGFVDTSRTPLEQTAKNAQTFSDALARNADGIDKFLASVSQLSDTVTSVSGRLDGTLTSAQQLLDSVDQNKVRTVVDNAAQISTDLRSTAQRIDAISARVDGVVASADTIVKSFNDTAATVNDVAKQSKGTLTKVDDILGAVNPDTVRSALVNVEETSRSANAAAANIRDLSQRAGPVVDNAAKVAGDVAKVTEAIGNRTGQIEQLIADAGAAASRLGDASTRVGSIVGRADDILQGIEPDTVRSALANIEETSRSANTAAANIRDLSQRAGPVVDNAAKVAGDVAKVTESISSRTGQIEQLIADAGALASRLGDASTRVGGIVGRAGDILQGIDPATLRSALTNIDETSRSANAAAANIRDLSQRAGPVVDNVAKVTESIGSRTGQIEQLIADAGALANRLSGASVRVGSVIGRADDILQGVDPEAVRQTVDTVQQAAVTANRALTTIQDASQTVSNIANDVNRVTSSVSARTDQINQFVADASQLAGRLNAASVRVDGILQRVDNLLGSDQANGLVVEASATLRSFRQVAETLNGRIGPLADSFQNLSTQGLSSVKSLVQDSQRAVNRIESAVDDLQRNPQRILTGGEGEVRRYNGRARR